MGRQANPVGSDFSKWGEKEGGRGGEGRDTLPRPTEGREAGGRRNCLKLSLLAIGVRAVCAERCTYGSGGSLL